MSTGLEAGVEKAFLAMLPPWLRPVKLNLQGNTGWPDQMILFVWPYIAFIEFKAPGKKLVGERNQPEIHAELRARGYPLLVTDSAEEAYAFLESVAISTTGRSLDDLSGMRGVTSPSRLGENYDVVRRDKNSP